MPQQPVQEDGSGVVVQILVQPRASRSKVVGIHDGAFKIQLTSAPVDGAANKDLIGMLAKKIGVAKSDIEILSGQTGRRKRIRIHGATRAQVEEALLQVGG
jgi:uncharacterized protein (TIGR00251 family)